MPRRLLLFRRVKTLLESAEFLVPVVQIILLGAISSGAFLSDRLVGGIVLQCLAGRGTIEFCLQSGQVTKATIPLNAYPWKDRGQVEAYYKGRKKSELLRDFGKPSKVGDGSHFSPLGTYEYFSLFDEPRRHWVYDLEGKLRFKLTFEIENDIIKGVGY